MLIHTSQRDFDYLFLDLRDGNIDRSEYVKRCNALYNTLPPEVKPNVDRRKDNRQLGVFCLQIYDNTARERFLVDEWARSLGYDVKIIDNGIGNDGRFILDPKGNSGRADYILKWGDGRERRLEVKFSPCLFKATFKVCDLKEYARQDALVLLVMGDTRMIGPNGRPTCTVQLQIPPDLRWCLFGRETIRRMLKETPIRNHKEVGGKPSIQLRDNAIERYLFRSEENL